MTTNFPYIDKNTLIDYESGVKPLKGRTSVQWGTIIRGKVEIGEDCLISPNCSIIASGHNIARGTRIRDQKGYNRNIIIGNDVWIGMSSCILGAVTIGDGAVIGAGSVVLAGTVIEENEIWAGNPAKKIKGR